MNPSDSEIEELANILRGARGSVYTEARAILSAGYAKRADTPDLNAEAKALLILAREFNVEADYLELFTGGNPSRGIPPGALRAVLAAQRADVWKEAIEEVGSQRLFEAPDSPLLCADDHGFNDGIDAAVTALRSRLPARKETGDNNG